MEVINATRVSHYRRAFEPYQVRRALIRLAHTKFTPWEFPSIKWGQLVFGGEFVANNGTGGTNTASLWETKSLYVLTG